MVVLMKPQDRSSKSPVQRVRQHLHMELAADTTSAARGLPGDLLRVLGRLSRVRSLGGPFQGIEVSPYIGEAFKSLKVVGNEMLVLNAERNPA